MVIVPAANSELIPGYVAIDRLGAGGYGEVWRVEAPGGLHKAIKVVYGYLTEDRAARELKALHHIREVRHPFLLSLERFEVVDGRLMIVTELADMSLMDRYEQCRKANQPGIPRAELLGYLHDAAEALDFMLQTHSLQHLDVKPENLLLVAGRTKVADFGLVKEIADKTRSLVGAMTPNYAAPEIFEGKACRHSDQYSLAVVFQEMLTGVLPFPGRNAAQLAAQHTKSKPQLASLPSGDREIVAKALAKRGEERFGSCREFIDALLGASGKIVPAEAPPAQDRPDPDTRAMHLDDTHTEVLGAIKPPSAPRPSPTPRSVTVVVPRASVTVSTQTIELPPPAIAPLSPSLRPAMFIGIGGTGAAAIEKMKRRLLERFNPATVAEAFPLLVVDTDCATMKSAAARGLEPSDIAHLPLKLAHEYRGEAEQLLPWLGRKWLYNIPKSGETQGMRPWGRLALVDHATTIVSKLRPRLAALAHGGAAAALAKGAPEQVRKVPPRVYLIAGAGGGTGGGMLVELAYAVKNLAERFPDAKLEVCAIITSSTNPCPTQAQLATANTAALLAELQHYVRCGGHGDLVAEAKAALFEGDGFPIDQLYFVNLGDGLTPEAYEDQIAALVDYVYCNLATPLGATLDGCRAVQEPEQAARDCAVRSFRLLRFEGVHASAIRGLAAQLAFAGIQRCLMDTAGRAQAHGGAGPSPEQTLLRTWAMQWLAANEARLWPPKQDARGKPEETPAATVRAELLKQLAALRQLPAPPEASPHVEALWTKVDGPTRAGLLREHLESLCERAMQAFVKDVTPLGAPPLTAALAAAAQQEATALLKRLVPGIDVGSDGALRNSPAPALAYLAQRAQARYPFGCRRRTFLMTPAGWVSEADKRGGPPFTHVLSNDAHAFVCEELEGISLAQLEQLTRDKHPQVADVISQLHTRVDIAWSGLAEIIGEQAAP